MKKFISNKYVKSVFNLFITILIFIAIFQLVFWVYAKPLLKKTIVNKVYVSSDSLYNIDFDKIKVNLIKGSFLLTNFKLSPDTNLISTEDFKSDKNIYEIELDTFEIEKLRFWKLLSKKKSLVVDEMSLINPNLKVFGVKTIDTSGVLKEKSATYETVRIDIISSAFSFVNSVSIENIVIKNGNFDFLKPRADNPNPFTVNSITFILNDFYADKQTFSADRKDIFSEDITLIIDGYSLNLNDNIHKLDAKRVNISTKNKYIELNDIHLSPVDKSKLLLAKINSNLFDFRIGQIRLNNADFKKIFVSNFVSINSASVKDFSAIIYQQKEAKKNTFNKDSLLNKVDVYPMFKNFLNYVKIDTLKIESGNFKGFNDITSTSPKTSIANYNVTISDFFIDSTSAADTSRIFYAKGFAMNVYGFKQKLNDSIHTLNVDYFVATSQKRGLMANSIRIMPDNTLKLWAKQTKKSFNNIFVESVNIEGVDFLKFVNYNQIYIDKVTLANSDIALLNFSDPKKKEKTNTPINELFLNFADKMEIKDVVFTDGKFKFTSAGENNKTSFSGNYRLKINQLSFDPYNTKITKFTKVESVDVLFTKVKYNTPDSIYLMKADSLYYSTQMAEIVFDDLSLSPIDESLFSRLQKYNRGVTVNINIPKLKISNTNLSNAFQIDSLSLKNIKLLNPVFEVVSYPNIRLIEHKKKIINTFKREAINKLVRDMSAIEVVVYDNFQTIDSASYVSLKIKHQAIDSIVKVAVNRIVELNIDSKDVSRNDTGIVIISQITKIANNSIYKIANDSIDEYMIDYIKSSAIKEINITARNYNSPKIDKDAVFNMIGQFLPRIFSDTLYVNDGLIRFKISKNGINKTLFMTNFNLKLLRFNFDTANLDIDSNLFFSESFAVNVGNTIINLPDSLHQLKIHDISITSVDSLISIKNVFITPKYIDTNQLCYRASIDSINFKSTNFNELYFNGNLKIRELKVSNPSLRFYTPVKSEKEKKQIATDLFLPKEIKTVCLNKIVFDNGNVKMFNTKGYEFFEANFTTFLYKFNVDSVSRLSENKFLIPIDNFKLLVSDVKLINPDSTNIVKVEKVRVVSDSGLIDIANLELLPIVNDTACLYNLCERKSIISSKVESIKLKGFDVEKLRFDNSLMFNKLVIDNPFVSVTKRQKIDNKKPFDIKEIDLYKIVKKYVDVVDAKRVEVNSLTLKMTDLTKNDKKENEFGDLSVSIYNLYIDSNVSVLSPNLFYADDISFSASNISEYIQDSIYTVDIGKIRGSTKNNSLEIEDLTYKPIVDVTEVQYLDKFKNGYRMTALSAYVSKLYFKSFIYRRLIEDGAVNINLIKGDSIILNVYTDRGYPHNDSVKQKHLIEHILDLKIPININLIDLNNFNLYYKEVNADNQDFAHISIDRTSLRIYRLTNDSVRINTKDTYTLIKASGYLNDSAQIKLDVYYELKSRGDFAKIIGEIGTCNASLFNSYTVNGANLMLEEGTINRIAFNFKTLDTIAVGKMRMEYQGLKAYVISKDTTSRRKLKFISWVANTFLVRNDNPKYGVYPKIGVIGYIHDRSYSDFKMWLKALISGVQSTVAFDSKDVKRIKKINRKNKDISEKK